MPTPDFQRIQEEFCAHLRDPDRHPAPTDIEDRRMDIYRGLFFHNIDGLICDAFPKLTELIGDEARERLARTFYAEHACRTPYFHRIGQEFVDFLATEHVPDTSLPPFLAELADYEWTDIRIRQSEQDPTETSGSIDPDGDLLEHPVALSPTAELRVYTWPVHRIGPGFQPGEAPETPTFLLAFLGQSGKTRFVELSPMSARLIALLQDQPSVPARSHLESISEELGLADCSEVLSGGGEILSRLRRRGAVLGTSSST